VWPFCRPVCQRCLPSISKPSIVSSDEPSSMASK
jgi:hypothetical protein